MKSKFFAFLALLTVVGISASATNSPKLWSERAPDAPPMVQLPNFRVLAQQTIPAVVSIQVEQRVQAPNRQPGFPGGGSDFFFRYFGGEMPREYVNRGLGTGFVISPEGLILTNYHVIEDATHIEVTFAAENGDEKKLVAKVLGTAPEYDVALIATEQNANAKIAYLGNSNDVQIGDWVMAVGNPFGLSHSVSSGIISAKERRDVMPSGRQGLYNFLQTDASINPGNSGGPLINMRGEVIGINSAINASGSGIGFAIPINMVKEMLPDLKAKGHYARSWIGIKLQPLTPELAQSFRLPHQHGALVADVVPNGPAAKAKIMAGDIVLEFNGTAIHDSNELPLHVSMAGIGKQVPVKIWRNQKEITLMVQLSEFPNESPVSMPEQSLKNKDIGMVIGDITPRLQQRLRLSEDIGVVVKDIVPGGAAEEAGLQPGDVILAINGEAVQTARMAAERIRSAPTQATLLLKVSRQGSLSFIALKRS